MSQLVYFQIPAPPQRACHPFTDIRSAVPPPVKRPRMAISVGEVAQFDECEDECDEMSQVPVRYRGRVVAAPLDAIRPIL